MRPPQWLYDVRHPLLAPKWSGRPWRWYHRLALAVVDWTLGCFELWQGRHGLRAMKEKADAMEDLARATERVRKAFERRSPQAITQGNEAKENTNG